jgi:hypothetical protein
MEDSGAVDMSPKAILLRRVSDEVFGAAQVFDEKMSKEDSDLAMASYGIGRDAVALAMGHANVVSEIVCDIQKSRGGFSSDEERDAVVTGVQKGFMYAYAWLSIAEPPPVVMKWFSKRQEASDESPR